MGSINKAILIGRLGKDPERKQTRDGKEFASFSMATSKKIKEEEKTTWHNVVVWNEHTARYVNDFAQKGTMVYVEGEIDNRTYQKQDGSTGYASDIVVGQYTGTVQIVTDGVPRGETAEPRDKVARKKSYAKEERVVEAGPIDEELNDEIPF
jgi:single-strand DNA-binding protein